jgi:hypothetical protein
MPLTRCIYLAARYDQHALMRRYAKRLSAEGNFITSRWINQIDEDGLIEGMSVEDINASPSTAAKYAIKDFQDISVSDTMIVFTDWPSSTGGRHVEFGYALGRGIHIIIVGPLENIFQAHEMIEHWDTVEEWEAAWLR